VSARTSALRRRRKPSLQTRLKIAWVFIVLVIASTGYAGYVIVTLPELRVHDVDVHVDGLAVSEGQILAAAQIDRRANLWLLDTSRMTRRIDAIPYVDQAEISRMPPNRLSIVVREREPAACVRSGRRVVTVDRTRRVLQVGCARRSALEIELRSGDLAEPGDVARAAQLANLLADGRVLADAGVRARSLGVDSFGQLVATDADGVRLLFGDERDLGQKARLVGPVLAAAGRRGRIAVLDLRAPLTPTASYAPSPAPGLARPPAAGAPTAVRSARP
jgi:cell division protein FtsQ